MAGPFTNQRNLSILPWVTNDFRELETAVNQLAVHADNFNRRWAQKWFEIFQFILGNQSLRWSKQWDFAIDDDFLRRQGGNRSRPSRTNISRTVLESLASMIYSQLGELVFESKYDGSSRGARLAKVLEGLAEAYGERLGLHEEFDYGSVILTMFAKVYGKVTWDRTAGGVFKRAKQQEVMAPRMTTVLQQDPVTGQQVTVPMPVLGPDGRPVMVRTFEDVLGHDGKPILETVRTGDASVEMLSPFEIRTDPMGKTFSRIKWIQHFRVVDYNDFLNEIADEPGLIESQVDKIQGGKVAGSIKHMAMRHFLRTMFSTPPILDADGGLAMGNMDILKDKVFVVEHYDRPTEGNRFNPTPWLAEGRRTIVANGNIILVSTPQYRTNKKDGWHPFCEAKWLPLAPSGESSGPMSDTIEKNRSINLTDTLTELAIKRQAGSTLLVNDNAGLDKNKLTGEPGDSQYVTGDPGAAAAWLSDKNPVPAIVTRYREQLKDDIYEVSGAQDSIRGERSIGATSGYQARLYEEREKKRTSKASNNWEAFVAAIYQKIFSCVQQNAPKLDDSVVSRIMRSAEGELSMSDVIDFLNGPVDYGVDVVVKAGSMSTKSHATKVADVQEAMQIPAIAQRLMQDPGMVDSYLDFLEIDVLRDISSVHRDRAKKENSSFLDLVLVRDPRQLQAYLVDLPLVVWQDDDMIHLVEHQRDFVKNFDKYKRNPLLLKIFSQHQAYHEQNLKAKQDQQSPYIASQAAGMEDRAEEEAAKPKNLILELKEFQLQKEQEALQAAAAQAQAAAAAGGPGTTRKPSAPAPQQDNNAS